MARGKRARRKGRARWWIGAVAAAVLVSLGALWAPHVTFFGGEPSDDDRRGIALQGQGSARTLLATCAADLEAADRAVSVAAAGVQHWRTHVEARTQMLDGDISLRTMTAIYERTRRRGGTDHDRFDAALRAVEGAGPCAELRSVNSESVGPPGPDCVARSQAAIEALAAARAAMADWQSHLHHMDSYDDGGMSTGTARRLWIAAWREAPGNIAAYHDKRRALARAPSCPGATLVDD